MIWSRVILVVWRPLNWSAYSAFFDVNVIVQYSASYEGPAAALQVVQVFRNVTPRQLVNTRVVPKNTARTHAHTSISTLKSLVNFCSRDFLFHKEFDDSTLAKRHIVAGHFVRSDTSHVMQAIDVTRHSRITQQLVPSTTALSFVCFSPVRMQKNVAHDFRNDPLILR